MDTSYLSVFSPNAGKYGPEKTSYFGHISQSDLNKDLELVKVQAV